MAVLTYLRRIIESLDHPDMINLILHYLLALPDPSSANEPSAAKSAASVARKRKSMDLATMMAEKVDVAVTPVLFNLVDLILACLKSHSQQTINVTLQLVSTILRRHHRYALTTLIRTGPVSGLSSRRTIGAHQQDVEFFMSVAGVMGGQDEFDDVYDSILRDVVVRLESHPCSLKLIAPKVSVNSHDPPVIPDSLPGAPRSVFPHTIRPDDPLLATIIDRLETFFVNPVDANLSTTEAILDLGTCGFVSLEGWILRHPDNYSFDDDASSPSPEDGDVTLTDDGDLTDAARAIAMMERCRKRPKWAGLPRLLTVLQTLADQVVAYRQTIPRFDDLLQQRREAFQAADSAPSPPSQSRNKNTPDTGSIAGLDYGNVDSTRSDSPARPSALENFAQRFLSELGTPSRSTSPGGKKDSIWAPFSTPTSEGGGNGTTSVTGFGGYGLATPTPSKSVLLPPKEFPVSIDTPSKSGIIVARSFSPGSQHGELPFRDGQDGRDGPAARDGPVASQMAAFRAIDRKILARRVGIPVVQRPVAPIPLRLNRPELVAPDNTSDNLASEPQQETKQADSDADGGALPSEDGDLAQPLEETLVTVSHVLTNTIILQSFLLELAALLQARAGLFDEVRFV